MLVTSLDCIFFECFVVFPYCKDTLFVLPFSIIWKVVDSDRIRQRAIYIRHYLPSTNLDTISDEDFAMLSEDALWLHQQTTVSRMSATLPDIAK